MTLESRIGRGSYRHSCPNCGGPNTEARLARGLPCPRCLPEELSRDASGIDAIARLLRKAGTIKSQYKRLASLEEEANNLILFFGKAVGSPAWGAQRTWARRIARGDSFSIIAPTGVGKTTFGIVASLYFAVRGERSYLVFPTTTLVEQAYRKAKALADRAGVSVEVVAIHSKMKRRERSEAEERLRAGEYQVLMTTASFARKNAEWLAGQGFKLVFVDDVDSVLRSSKSVDAILKIVGFGDEDLEAGMELLRLQRRIASLRAQILRLQLERARRKDVERRIEALRRELRGVEREAEKLSKKVERARRRASILVVSSATGRPRGARVRLFRVLLGFEAGGRSDIGLRRVVDSYTYPSDGLYERVVELVSSRFPDGTLVYVPIDHGIEGAEKLAEMLREAGLRAEAFHSKKPLSILDEFAEGGINVLVGVANYYGVLVRGLDMPARIKYAVFAGVPRHRFSAEIGEPHPGRLLRLLGLLVDAPIEDVAEEARKHVAVLRRIVRRLSPAALQLIAEKVLEGDVEASGVVRAVWEAYNFLRNAMADPEVWRYLEERGDVAVTVEEGKRFLLIADAATYIQASGRTSRLYAGGITLGLSVVVVDNEKVFRGLVKRTQWMVETRWERLEDLDLDQLVRAIEEERRRVQEVLGGTVELGDLVRTALLVVESPNKARTIAGFFGQPSIRILPGGLRVYEVATGDYILSIAASGGHVYDLVTDASGNDVPGLESVGETVFGVVTVREDGREYIPVYTSIKRCLDCGYQFTEESDRCPVCGSSNIRDSRIVVDDLRRVAWEVDEVLIGTDPDTEGEKIGWDVALLLMPYSRRITRLEFHEVTRKAIMAALRATRDFDQGLVDAQIVRRIEDRWIGFTLSPLLWCHFWPHYYCPYVREYHSKTRDSVKCSQFRYYYNLSAGRVQTPTLGWIIERTLEAKEKVNVYRLEFDGSSIIFREDEAEGKPHVLRELFTGKGKSVEVDVLVQVVGDEWTILHPAPPYTTDAMIADASRYLRMGAPETMRLAQNLFEWGLITYHRTDSTRVSDKGIQVARDWLGEAYPDIVDKVFRPRRWGEGGAHEAIRPTRPIDAETLRRLVEEGIIEVAGVLTNAHYRLYDLIFRRFIASQMAEAKARRTSYKVTILGADASIRLERLTMIGEPGKPWTRGFTLVWTFIREQDPLPTGTLAGVLHYVGKRSRVPLYTQGEVISLMKERGIGRPSTYAKIMETLLRRGYVARVGEDRVVATLRGQKVYEYLTVFLREADTEHLPSSLDPEALRRVPSLVSEERTRALQEKMDQVERGEASRVKILDEIYSEIEGIALPIVRAFERARYTPSGDLEECLSGYRSNRRSVRA